MVETSSDTVLYIQMKGSMHTIRVLLPEYHTLPAVRSTFFLEPTAPYPSIINREKAKNHTTDGKILIAFARSLGRYVHRFAIPPSLFFLTSHRIAAAVD